MAEKGNNRLSLPPAEVLEDALRRYDDVVARQGVAKLAELDRWYRRDWPMTLRSRQPLAITHAELVRVTEWKMSRGVWRAPNLALVRSNAAEAVESCSATALAQVPHPTLPLKTLVTLEGVGPATASAVLAAAAPEAYPFFDEIVAARLPGLGPVAWTLPYYARYAEALRGASAGLGASWTPASLAHALWAYAGGKAGASPA